MGLGKPGRLGVDQPTITVELGPASDAYTHCSPVMIAALSKTAGRKKTPREAGPECPRSIRCGNTRPN